MSTARFYNERSVSTATSTGYGTAWKMSVANLVSIVPGLSIGEVVQDTSSTYEAYVYHPRSSRLRWRFYNNSSYAYAYTQILKADGSWYSYSTDRVSMSSGEGTYTTAYVWGIGDWMVFWQMAPPGYPYQRVHGAYAYFTDASGAVEVPLLYSYSYSSNGYTPQAWWPSWYTYNDEAQTYTTVGFYSDTSGLTPALYSGAPYALYPKYIHATLNNSQGFLNIKWGGAYTLYQLYDLGGSYDVTQRPGSSANVNGTTIQSLGYVFLAV